MTRAQRTSSLFAAARAGLAVWLLGLAFAPTLTAQSSQLLYQGEIKIAGAKAEGELDFRFVAFDAAVAGTQIGSTVFADEVEVRDGLFDVPLDFGIAYDGTPLWLEIAVREAGTLGPYQVLAPRRVLGSAPGALWSSTAVDADTVDGLDAADLSVQSVELVGTVLRVTEGAAVFEQDLAALVVDDADMDPTDELNTAVGVTGTTLEVTDAGGTLTADLAPLQDGVTDADADPANEVITSAQLIGTLLELIENGQVTNLVDVQDLLNSGMAFDGTTLTVTDGGGTLAVDLSSVSDGVDDADPNPANELNTALGLTGTDVSVTDAGGTLTADLSGFPVEDADADPNGELIDGLTLTNGADTLEIVEAGITNQVDVGALQNAALAFDGTTLSVTDGGGTLQTDLSSLGDDADANPANELNTAIAFDGADLTVTDAGGTLTADLTTLPVTDADADPTGELIDALTLTNGADTLEIVEAGITNQVDVTALQNSAVSLSGTTLEVTDGGGTLSADLAALGDDADANPANELNTGLTFDGTDVTVTDAGGSLSAELSGLADGVTDADADPANELITALALPGGDTLEIVEAGITNQVDVSALENTSLALVGDSLQVTDGGGTLATDLSSLGDDADPSSANELNTGFAVSGSSLELTDAGGTLSADLSALADGVADADADPLNELITSATLTNSGGTLEIVEGGITNLVDVTALRNSTLSFVGSTIQVSDAGGSLGESLIALVENNTALALNATTVELTDSGGTVSADIASIDGVNDADTVTGNELITATSLTGDTLLEITEGAQTLQVDLLPLAGSEPTALYDNLGWVGDSGVVGTGPGSTSQKIFELVETATSNRFEIDFNRIQPGTIITNIPITLTEPGFYYLIHDLSNSVNNADGITIDVDDVTLDMMGYKIVGGKFTGVNSDDGIFVSGSQTNIKVRNGAVIGWNGDGINALNADFSIWSDLHVRSNDGDGLVGDFNNLMVRITAYSNGLDGVEGDDGTVIFHSTAGQNGDNGIQTSEGSSVINCASFDNETDGIDVGAGSLVDACTATDNGVFGFDIALGGQAVNSVAYDNMSNGFDMASACILRSCIGSLNNGHGVRMFANSWIIGNKFHENDLDGIRISSTDCHVEGNQVTDNDQVGIHATASGSFIVKNTSAGNLTNYLIDENCAFGPIVNVTNAGDISGVANADHPWVNFEF
ncbi:MAG: right-handed parallel beta-helix repeat-containing protein [Acidobacteriota bacterium]